METALATTVNADGLLAADGTTVSPALIAKYGPETARRIADARDAGHAIRRAVTPANTQRTYAKSAAVWERFCADAGLPTDYADAGILSLYAGWLLKNGKPDGTGYALSSARTHMSGAIHYVRATGYRLTRDDTAPAYSALEGAHKGIEKTERRGRGQAEYATAEELAGAYLACPDTLAGWRDRALLLVGFHIAARSSELAGLLVADVVPAPRGLRVSVKTAKTKYSARDVAVPRSLDVELCAARAWKTFRQLLERERPDRVGTLTAPAFPAVDRHDCPRGGMSPEAVSDAVGRIGARAGHPGWTGHTLRASFATSARAGGADMRQICRQGGWAPGSAEVLRYMRIADEFDDNACHAAVKGLPEGFGQTATQEGPADS
ncbi:tyrosine-type recombinase/integrase [Streptomyces benahoarensis]|uniref:Tyrosine-type recombinase/integrase n=1 Tax=Streptomyces benahoarensis TaxID=2595054 RepID=A0A553ZJ05_9ACTN|nr:tyrosine-type recombinase/integrase [Streptomyces benahoarensis]TSB31885.1 tyrosine-type recombinase/integrase [Streptomyces benahoarensis]TSB41326.1 tyrosine-type recombinase/integrase [Streptomyces benahoarensis]